MKSQLDIVDFHTHILPEVDHGCDTVETALKQLKLAKSAGVNRIVLTPHFYPHIDSLDEFLQKRSAAYGKLIETIGENTADYPDVRLGCEVLVCEGISKLPKIEELCISGTKTLLLELPFSDFSRKIVDDVENLIDSGFEVVLAHADRYAKENIAKLLTVGAKLQLNADALACIFVPKSLKRWLSSECVVAIGSDIHMLNRCYYYSFRKASAIISKKYASVVEFSDKIWQTSKK